MGDDQSNPWRNRDPGDETRADDPKGHVWGYGMHPDACMRCGVTGLEWLQKSEPCPGVMKAPGCDIYGYPVYDPLQAMRDAADESEPDALDTLRADAVAEIGRLQVRIAQLRHALRQAHADDLGPLTPPPLSATWHHPPCVTAGLADPRVQHPLWVAIRKGWGR